MNNVDIEKTAESILIKENIFQPGVKADRIAEFNCDLETEWIDLNRFRSDVKILAAISFVNKKIYMNSSCEAELKSNPGRMNFTIAHELGHWILHKDLAQAQLPGFEGNILICRGVNHTSNNPERQANFFAACLLMPRAFIEEALKNLAAPIDDYDITRLSREFCVSRQAMKIRLVDDLHLLYGADGMFYRSKEEFLEASGQQTLF